LPHRFISVQVCSPKVITPLGDSSIRDELLGNSAVRFGSFSSDSLVPEVVEIFFEQGKRSSITWWVTLHTGPWLYME
jgi:hypothetical protein